MPQLVLKQTHAELLEIELLYIILINPSMSEFVFLGLTTCQPGQNGGAAAARAPDT